jgi:raffinose/stachyose/melibiose transport system substrate-binding protein
MKAQVGLVRVLVLAGALVACATAAGCGDDGEGAADAPAKVRQAEGLDRNYEGSLEILSFFGVDTYKAVDDFVKERIQRKYPNVEIKFQYTDPSGITQRIKTGVASGDPADFAAYLPGPSFVELAESGSLLDLSPLISNDPALQKIATDWEERVPEGQYKHDGRTLGIVATLGPMSIWYWKSLFEEAGIDSPPATIDELVDAAKRLRDSGVQPMSMGLETASLFTADYTFNHLMSSFDEGEESKARAADRGELPYTDPAFADALGLFKRLYDEGVFNDSVLQDSYDPGAKNLWKDRKVAMFWQGGPWMARYVSDEAARDIGVMYFPTVDGAKVTASGTDLSMVAFGVSDKQKSPDHGKLIAEVIKAYLSPEAQAMYYDAGIFPADTSVVDGSASGIWASILEQQVALLDEGDRVVDYATYQPDVYAALTNGIQAMLLGDKSVDDVVGDLEEAQKKAYECAPSC